MTREEMLIRSGTKRIERFVCEFVWGEIDQFYFRKWKIHFSCGLSIVKGRRG